MQLKAQLTEDEILACDPLACACHSIGKLKAAGHMIVGFDNSEVEMTKEIFHGLSDIIIDAAEEIEFLIECNYKKIALEGTTDKN